MSELIQKNQSSGGLRWKLLTGVSALTLAAYTATPDIAAAQDQDHSTVWIELGTQMSKLGANSEPYDPDFTSMRPSNFSPSSKFEKSPRYSIEEVGKLSLKPSGSEWVFSASVRYGRSSVHRHVHEQSPFAAPQSYVLYPSHPTGYYPVRSPRAARFAETTVGNSEQHFIADFQAGRDVGLGLFGNHGSSAVSLGVRFAQFNDKSNVSLKSDPDWHFQPKTVPFYGNLVHVLPQAYHSNFADFHAGRSFEGIGPSVSWNSSESVTGNRQDGALNVDWGLNAAVLFGRQKSRIQRTETVHYNSGGYGLLNFFFSKSPYGTVATVYHHAPAPHLRSHSAVVPNVGGFAGLSFKYDTAKLTLGYRADFFFGAMDGGVDARKTYDRDFYGPYASISIGLGG